MEHRLWSSGASDKNKAMVEQLQRYGIIKSSKVAEVMEAIDRGVFVPPGGSPYFDSPMPIGYNATISAPHMHAACLELLEKNLQPGMRALDVGSGGSRHLHNRASSLQFNSRAREGDSVRKTTSLRCFHSCQEQSKIKQSSRDHRWPWDIPQSAHRQGRADVDANCRPKTASERAAEDDVVSRFCAIGAEVADDDGFQFQIDLALNPLLDEEPSKELNPRGSTVRPDKLGEGTGYLTACFALMVGSEGRAVGVEHIPELVASSIENIKKSAAAPQLNDGSLSIHITDGREGWPELAPYDAIHVGAAAQQIPEALIEQLKPGGRMVIPVGTVFQELKVVDKKQDGSVSTRDETSVRYVPLTSKEAQLHAN